MLKPMFLILFFKMSVEELKCGIYKLSKHRRPSPLMRGARTSIPLTFIYGDVWGPSFTHNILEEKWFITLIDDYSHIAWIHI